jgi:hypothetical protein
MFSAKEKPLSLRLVAARNRHSKTGVRFLQTATTSKNSTSKNVAQDLHPFRRARYATMLQDASEGIIFRDSQFCKEELHKICFSMHREKKKVITSAVTVEDFICCRVS